MKKTVNFCNIVKFAKVTNHHDLITVAAVTDVVLKWITTVFGLEDVLDLQIKPHS